MPRYRHYKNLGEGDQVVFFTTTILNFEPIFLTTRCAGIMAGSLLDDCRFYGAALYAFVVMPHHVHFLCRLPSGHDSSWFMNRIKSNSAKRLLPHLEPSTRDRLAASGTNQQRALWQASFRSYPVTNEREFVQKIDYIDQNPVRAGLVTRMGDYTWGSASLYEKEGAITWDGISFEVVPPAMFCSAADLVIAASTRGRAEA